MSDTVRVTYALEFDREFVQNDTLDWWRSHLRMESDEITWDDVYKELARVIIGSQHYKKFSVTAIDDSQAFAGFQVGLTVGVENGKPDTKVTTHRRRKVSKPLTTTTLGGHGTVSTTKVFESPSVPPSSPIAPAKTSEKANG